MYKLVIAGAVTSLGFIGFAQQPDRPHALFKEERMTVHYTPAEDEATIVVKAETEAPLQHVEVKTPMGGGMLRMRAQDSMGIALQGFVLETGEMDADQLFATYPEGSYDFRGLAVGRLPLTGGAVLSHDLLPEPVVMAPLEGAVDVDPNGLTVTWQPQPGAAGYRIGVEQNDNDGLNVELPPTTHSFTIPGGFLLPQTPTQVEVGVIADNGNTTMNEVYFTTQ